jgi:L-ribulose-5-phosphate 3-epimerase
MPLTRRELMLALAASSMPPALAGDLTGVQLGIMDGILGFPSNPESVSAAANLGLAGVQVTIGQPDSNGRLLMSDKRRLDSFVRAASERAVQLPSTYLDVLHVNCLKNDPLALKWIQEGIRITKALNVKVLMLVFFGKCGLVNRADIEAVVAPLRTAAKWAEEAGITLGFENTISAEENARVLDAVKSPALKVWYDIGNSTNIGHFDVPREIRFLGSERICQFHFKDTGYLGEGSVRVQDCLKALADIRYRGFIILETAAPTRDRLTDAAKNIAILRGMMRAV